MIAEIVKLLNSEELKGVSESIDFAKGKYKKPESVKEVIKKFNRKMAWLKKG